MVRAAAQTETKSPAKSPAKDQTRSKASAKRKTPAGKTRARSARRPLSPKPAAPKLFGLPLGLIALGLLGLVIASGVQVASKTHEVRRLHSQLESMGKEYNALLAENSRLTLERGARASYARVEKEAVENLAMHFPDQIVTITEVSP